MVFHSIRETAKLTGISENTLRIMLRNGDLPGFYTGRKFLINLTLLDEKLNAACRRNGGAESAGK